MSYEAFAFHAIANRIQITYDGCFAHVGLVRMDDELILYLYLKRDPKRRETFQEGPV